HHGDRLGERGLVSGDVAGEWSGMVLADDHLVGPAAGEVAAIHLVARAAAVLAALTVATVAAAANRTDRYELAERQAGDVRAGLDYGAADLVALDRRHDRAGPVAAPGGQVRAADTSSLDAQADLVWRERRRWQDDHFHVPSAAKQNGAHDASFAARAAASRQRASGVSASVVGLD